MITKNELTFYQINHINIFQIYKYSLVYRYRIHILVLHLNTLKQKPTTFNLFCVNKDEHAKLLRSDNIECYLRENKHSHFFLSRIHLMNDKTCTRKEANVLGFKHF